MVFVFDESGAVTVDWVVLTGALVGVAGVTTTTVLDVLDEAASQIEITIGSARLLTSLYSSDFSNGSDDWSGDVSYVNGFGSVLGPLEGDTEGTEMIYKTFEIPEGSTQAKMEFDLLSLDSIDTGEGPKLYLNGEVFATGTMQSSNKSVLEWSVDPKFSEYGIQIENIQSGDLGGNLSGQHANWGDSVDRVSVTINNPGTDLSLGLGLVSDSPATDESVAIDNFDLSVS